MIANGWVLAVAVAFLAAAAAAAAAEAAGQGAGWWWCRTAGSGPASAPGLVPFSSSTIGCTLIYIYFGLCFCLFDSVWMEMRMDVLGADSGSLRVMGGGD